MHAPHPTRAVVLGRGIAGLLTARALSERFDEVTVVDRDGDPPDAPRRGVPQGRHAHALLASGQQALEDLLPGLTAELVAAGAPTGDVLDDTHMHMNGHRLASTETGLVALSASRPLLEGHVHRRVAAIRNVTFAPPTDVVGLVADRDGGRVCGVRLLRRADGSTAESLEADLVVDALGRTSRSPRWLEAIGHAAPPEERIAVELRYSTRCFRTRPDDLDQLLACVHGPTPDRPSGCVLARIERDRWILTLAGMTGTTPPRDAEGFRSFARSLRSPEVDEILACEALDEPVPFRFPASLRRRYDAPSARPPGFLAVGDSLCSLNPVYGQGMSVAALQARALLHAPSLSGDQLWSAVVRPVDDAWAVVRATDLAFPGVDGQRRPGDRILGSYVGRLHAAASADPVLSTAFIRVAGLLDPPTRLLRPRIVVRTLAGNLVRPSTSILGGGFTERRMLTAALLVPASILSTAIAAGAATVTAWRRRRRSSRR